MTAIVFSGPTLAAEAVREILPSSVLAGPAAVGDLYRASCRQPTTIVLIDGYFDHRLSVWHKEILWALSRGQRVYGASSMGALRAVELSPFGMIGVGKVFELYRSGELEDDDEVAVVHEEADSGYRRRSEAMVNVRVTLAAARSAGVLSAGSERILCEFCKRLFYAERSYAALLEAAAGLGLPDSETQALRDYLHDHGPIDQKRADAIELLERVRDDSARPDRAKVTAIRFAWTNAWQVFTQKAATAAVPPAVATPEVVATEAETGELEWGERLRMLPPEVAKRVWSDALERAFALVLADDDDSVAHDSLQAESEAFRRGRGLLSQEQVQVWMRENDVDVEAFSSLIHQEVLVGRHRSMARRLAMLQVANALRASSEYGMLKANTLGATGDSA